ncbi:MAG: SIMPL domain-containing protein [Solirubrobacteraceae bacterium]
MRPRTWVALVVGCSVLAAAPAAAAQPDTVTATGTGQSVVHPKNPNNSPSIASAYDAARQAAIGGALKEAHTYAVAYAKGVGLTLGSVVSVSDAQNNVFYGPGQFVGPFGPNQFCGTLRQPIFKKEKNGRRKVVGTKKMHRCIVPRFAFVSLTVTYSAT